MYVVLPWKTEGKYFRLRPDQVPRVEYYSKGRFLRVRNAVTGRLNKCRVVDKRPTASPPTAASPTAAAPHNPIKTLGDLVGKRVSGVVARTGPAYVSLLVDRVEGLGHCHTSEALGFELFTLAHKYLAAHHISWNVHMPRSWTLPATPYRDLGPHVSLHEQHMADVGTRVTLTVAGVMHWEENSRWVALRLKGPLKDHTGWHLHLSCAQDWG